MFKIFKKCTNYNSLLYLLNKLSIAVPLQLTALVFNFLTVFLVSNKIYLSHRIQYDAKAKRSILNILSVLLFILLQLVGHVTVWTIIYVCFAQWAYLCILLTVFAYCLMLMFVITNAFKTVKRAEENIDPSYKSKDIKVIYWTAVVSSWISPCTTWWNNLTYSSRLKRTTSKKKKLFLFIAQSNFSTLCEFLTVSVIFFLLNNTEFLKTTNEEGGPIVNCIQNIYLSNQTYTNFSWIKIRTFGDACKSDIRICQDGERPMDLFATLIPTICIPLLLLAFTSSTVLNFIGKFTWPLLFVDFLSFVYFNLFIIQISWARF